VCELSTDRADRPFTSPVVPLAGRAFRCDRRETSDGAAKAWIEEIPKAVAKQIERADGEQDREPRKKREPGLRADEVPTLADHHAPLRRRRLRAESDEAEARRGDDRRPHVEARLDQKWRERVRKQMPEED